jgi:redox-sensitive bicupin YhaK (pirin superfamily)
VSSETFKEEGGPLEILQLWLNLPSHLKITTPQYLGKEESEIPIIKNNENGVKAQLLFGEWHYQKAAFEGYFPLFLATLYLNDGAEFSKSIPEDDNIFCYVVRGKIQIGGQIVPYRNLIEFEDGKDKVSFIAVKDSIVLFGHAKPFGEPIVAQGPFVMNSQQEIMQAYRDFQEGKFE